MKKRNCKTHFCICWLRSKDLFALLQEEIGVHRAEIRVILNKDRKESVFDIVNRLSVHFKTRDDIKIVYEIPRNIITEILNLEKTDFAIHLHSNDSEKLSELETEYTSKLNNSGLFKEIESSLKEGKPQFKVSFDQEALAGSGVNSKAVYDLMSIAIQGSKASSFRRDDDHIDIKVILNETDRSEFSDISRLFLQQSRDLCRYFHLCKMRKLQALQRYYELIKRIMLK